MLEQAMSSIVDVIVGGLVLIVMLFIAIVLIIAMAPVIGQLGGVGYEALFVIASILIIVGGVLGYLRGR